MADDHPNNAEERGHEPTSVSARGVSLAVAVLLAAIVASLALMAGLGIYLSSLYGGKATVRPRGTLIAPPPGIPAVDANQTGTLRALRARENALLTSYEWLDRKQGVARIPIDRAMEILADQPPAETPDEDMAIR